MKIIKSFLVVFFLLISTLFVRSQTITITQPNGAEILYACQQYTISWNVSGTVSNYYDIDYSLDGGTIWASVTTNYFSPAHTYSWTVPNIQSGTVLVRVKDTNNGTIMDVSNAFFTINIPITVIAPNGGETYTPFTNQTISWNAAGTSNNYNIYYSTNGGSIWNTIATNYNSPGATYNWNVPNTPSTNCLVRVQDAVTSCMVDQSNAVFTINPLTPLMTYPNGGEQLNVGSTINITWDLNTFYNTVRLEYSTNNGSSWTTIASSTTNDGSEAWTLPYLPLNQAYSQCLVRVSNSSVPALNDVSNVTFTIRKPLTLNSPNGGEVWTGCNSYNISSSLFAAGLNSWSIFYSTNNGSSWNTLTTSSTPSYNWGFPNTLNSTQALIRVINNTYPQYSDTSNAVFTMQSSNDVVVTAPNGGEVLTPGSTFLISWTNTPSVSGAYNITYTSSAGSGNIATNITGNNFLWTVPNLPATNYTITVSDVANSCKQDQNNAVFTVSPLTPLMTYPNGGEQFNVGSNVSITWDPNTFYSDVRIEYSSNNGTTWNLIANSHTNSGSYSPPYYGWVVPYVPLNQVYSNWLIKVSETANLLRNDISNATFSTRKPLTLNSPNGGETWVGCANASVNSTNNTALGSGWQTFYSLNNGASWNSIGFAGPSGSWTVPTGLSTTQALVRTINTTYPQYADTSNAVFNITFNNDITVTAPNGGETLTPGSTYLITWTNTAGVSGLYNVSYTSSAGSGTIATAITGNSFLWTVPNLPATNYTITVSDNANSCKQDQNNATFTVSPLTPLLTYPNGGEQFNLGENVAITWDPNTFYSNVRIEYSSNNGVTWNLIANNHTNSGSYSLPYYGWVIPYMPLNQVYSNWLVKVSETANLLRNDVSNATFSTRKPLTLNSPNGGETWVGCANASVTSTNNTALGSGWQTFYSLNNGASWSSIGFAGPSGSWTVPTGISTTQALVRTINTTYPQYADTSNAVFNITYTNAITVTAPNGGETLTPGSTYLITWTNTAGVSGSYNLSYTSSAGSGTIATNITGNGFLWTVPNLPATNYIITVSDYANSCKQDQNNAPFTVGPLAPQLLTPNGGQVLYYGENYTITWNSNTFYTNVRIDFSTDNGSSWTALSTNESNDGSYSWTGTTRPNILSTNCLIKVSSVSLLTHNDVSDATFTIKPAVSIITPNGGENLGGCTVTSLTFERSPAYSTYSLEYSSNGGSSWSTISGSFPASGNPSNYNWTLPNNPTTQGLVRVIPTSLGASFADVSNSTFSVIKPVTIIQPNFGGIMTMGSTYNIQWNSDGISNFYDIHYSTNGGSTWITVVLNYPTSTNTYAWTVPATPSTNCMVRVRDAINTCKEDISDIPFTISNTSSAITLLSPNGIADSLTGCSTVPVTWTDSPTIGTYDLAYSTNGGTSWVNIVTGYNTVSHSYNWIVPNTINTNNVLLRVSSTANSSIYDWSNAAFTILNGHVVASPDTTTVCYGVPVSLNATGGVNYSWSPVTGLSNPNIANPTATPSSSTAYIVTSNNGGCILKDTVVVNITSGPLVASVNISASPGNSVCSGDLVSFTATPVNGGSNPVYQWKINGVNVGTDSSVFSTAGLSNGAIVTCQLTSNLLCVAGSPDQSNPITMVVNAPVAPAISIVSNDADNTICIGTMVIFTASVTNGGPNPAYQWKVNGVNVGINSPTYSSSALNNGDIVTCVLTSDLACASPATISSSGITMFVNATSSPTISISSNDLDNVICAGTSVIYNAAISNGGSTPVYQWKVNGVNVGTNSSTFSSSGLNNGDVVSCVLTSNATCISVFTASSNNIVMTVNPTVTPGISISSDDVDNTICLGTVVTFTASTVNGGPSPSYQWKVNGVNVGTNSPNYVTSGLINGDVVTCVLTSNANCSAPSSAASNAITMNVNPVSNPSISITSNDADNIICMGTTVVYTANIINGGSLPVYQWKVNGVNAGTNSPTFSTNALNNGDIVTCVLTSNASCVATSTSNSNAITMTVQNNVSPSISISSDDLDNIICAGSMVTYTASVTNGGVSPVYQWKVNGINAGTNSPVFASAAINNGDVITCNLTSSLACASPASINSTAIVMGVINTVTPAITISSNDADNIICAGTNILFTAAPTNGGASPVYQWKINGINVGTNSATHSTSGLINGDVVTCVLTSSHACPSPVTASSNPITITVSPAVTPGISIVSNDADNIICVGNTVTYTASITNGGTTPVYQWKINGVNAGTNSPTFITSSLNNGDIVTCVLTSNALCLNSNNISSSGITMTVNSSVTPSVSIASNDLDNVICAGTNVIFTATPTNGGVSPVYQWQVNGSNVGTGSSYNTSTLVNGDVVTCNLTSSVSCASPATVNSPGITMSVNPSVTPSISIVSDDVDNIICASTAVTFTATPTNGGASPAYQWKVNGTNVGTNSATYSSSGLNNGDVVTCVLTSSHACPSPVTAGSNPITITVNPAVTPGISIVSNDVDNIICVGNTVTYTASITNGGTTPVYQWKINGVNVGTNSPTFITSSLNNGDVVTCVLTSNALCLASNNISSSGITMIVNSSVTPSVSIASNDIDNIICAGTNVIFTATPTNGGASPVYQWQVNGSNVGTGSSYSTSALVNGDIVTCQLTSSVSCASPATVNAAGITMTVNPSVTPSVSIVSNDVDNIICASTTVIFTATPTNGGVSPVYQWQVNGSNVGTNSATYSTSGLNNGDVVSCILTSSSDCASPVASTSNGITISVVPVVLPTISISSNDADNIICSGTNVTYTAITTNGGAVPNYQWQVNGTNVGLNSPVYSNSALSNGDIVSCIFTSNAVCASPSVVTSNSIIMGVINSLNPTISISSSDADLEICSGSQVNFSSIISGGGSSPTYQWQVNGTNVGTGLPNYSTSVLNNGDVVTCQLISSETCASPAMVSSNTLSFVVNPGITVNAGVDINICTGASVTLTASGSVATYTWSGGITDGVPFNPLSSQTYIVNAINVNGCTDADTILVTVNPLPVVNLGADIIQPNPPVVLDAGSGFASYLWNIPATTQTITVTNNGTYAVQVTDIHGCTDTDTIQVFFTTGIDDMADHIVINLYPNPNNGDFTVTINNLYTDQLKLQVLDMAGKIIYDKEYIPEGGINTIPVHLGNLRVGTYILEIQANGQSYHRRFIINE